MRGKQSRPAPLKGVAEDKSLMAEVVDDDIISEYKKRSIRLLNISHFADCH